MGSFSDTLLVVLIFDFSLLLPVLDIVYDRQL